MGADHFEITRYRLDRTVTTHECRYAAGVHERHLCEIDDHMSNGARAESHLDMLRQIARGGHVQFTGDVHDECHAIVGRAHPDHKVVRIAHVD